MCFRKDKKNSFNGFNSFDSFMTEMTVLTVLSLFLKDLRTVINSFNPGITSETPLKLLKDVKSSVKAGLNC